MSTESVRELERNGFTGFASVADLQRSGGAAPPQVPGVYVVLRSSPEDPSFLTASIGGWFKGRDPSVPSLTLRQKWVEGTPILYVGRTGNLQRRIKQLVKFGEGSPVGHWGGRYLWQLSGSDALLIAWRPDPEFVRAEAAMLATFVVQHGRLPFANLRN